MVDHLSLLARHGFRKLRRIRDGGTGRVEDLFELPRAGGGKPITLRISPSRAQRPHELLLQLLDNDVDLPKDPNLRKAILSAMAAAEPEKRVFQLSRPGWARNGSLFSAPGRLIGNAKQYRAFKPKRSPSPYRHFQVEGSLPAWQKAVAKSALFSSAATLAISAAFGAPLLKLARMSSFEIVLFARTRTGKTFIGFLAASVLGLSAQEFLENWLISDAALQERLADFNDMLLVIDDLNTFKGSPAQIAQRIEGLSYAITTGTDLTRHSSFKAGEQNRGGWRGILLTTAEWSIAELASKAGTSRQPGAAVRLIDVPAVLDESEDIFDRVPEDISPGDRLQWGEDIMAEMRSAASSNHGLAFDLFVERCVQHRAELEGLVRKAMRAFMRHVRDASDTSVHRDMARKFAIIYAGASLAIRFGVLPWKRTQARDAIARCYRAARALIVDEQQLLKSAFGELQETLRRLPLIEARKVESLPAKAHDGYRCVRQGEEWALIRVDVLSQLLGAHRRALVLEWLAAQGAIRMARVTGDAPRPKDQITWADGIRRRSYQIMLLRTED